MHSRRDLLRTVASVAAPCVLAATPFSILGGTGVAKAQDPATIAVAIAALDTIAAFMASSASSGLDPASQAYFERILANQELIARQIADISSQIEDLAKLVTLVAPQTVALKQQVQAKGVFHSATGLEISFLQAVLKGNPSFADGDRAAFTRQVGLLETAAAEHLALVEDVGQSVDTIVAIDALRLALGALINAARQAGFTSEADKRALHRGHMKISQAAQRINSGAFKTRTGSFRDARAKIRNDIVAAADAIAGTEFAEPSDYSFSIETPALLGHSPTRFDGVIRSWYSYEHYDDCQGGFVAWPDDAQAPVSGQCTPSYTTVRDYSERPAVIEKVPIKSIDDDPDKFVLSVNPVLEQASLITHIEAFNRAKRLDNLHHAAEAVLKRTLRTVEPVAAEIEAL